MTVIVAVEASKLGLGAILSKDRPGNQSRVMKVRVFSKNVFGK